ncbi:hypothetical protein J4861_02490 [Prevotella melaninogenica]|uniref:hypothetical protein n=1 Tax=Prevotella melaninogenica TaxID=28132 RepID=UPI001BA65CE9|nr:hypothetical protein [Prevotella melaninogenica]QUB60936.1 hypothetical protein J4861_02490 [Prevotella melaninogenica]
MHANVQTRFNPATGDMAPYYRIKESYIYLCNLLIINNSLYTLSLNSYRVFGL